MSNPDRTLVARIWGGWVITNPQKGCDPMEHACTALWRVSDLGRYLQSLSCKISTLRSGHGQAARQNEIVDHPSCHDTVGFSGERKKVSVLGTLANSGQPGKSAITVSTSWVWKKRLYDTVVVVNRLVQDQTVEVNSISAACQSTCRSLGLYVTSDINSSRQVAVKNIDIN